MNLPIFALYSILFHLLGKVILLTILPPSPVYSAFLSHTRSFCWHLIILTSPKAQNLSSETVYIISVLLFHSFSLKHCLYSMSTLFYLLLTCQTNLIASLSQLSFKLPALPILLKLIVTFLSPPPE